MLNGQSAEDFETEVKRKFIEEPAQMKLLIVVDKLLTGFDAPPCTVLYIDKSMHDHGLFQAICRVNRLDGEEKDFGYIVDYKQLFGDLADALKKYTSGAFEGYSPEDIEGLIKDRLTEAKKYLDQALEELEDLCGGVPMPRAEIDFIHYFCGENGVGGIDDESCSRSRERLYKLVNRLVRAYSEIKGEIADAGYTASEQSEIDGKVVFYTALKETIGNASGDFIDLKSYEADMRRLIDTYIRAEDSRGIGKFDDFTLLDFVAVQGEKLGGSGKESAAEAIENNIRKKIVEKILINPKYYEKMSAILDELIKERRKGAIAYEKLLDHYRVLLKAEVARVLPKWESITGQQASKWQVKYMRTHWGSCNTKTGLILLNLQLAKKTPDCLEYIILHELVHLIEKSHNEHFVSQMDHYMPMWREVKATLNGQMLDFFE